MINFDIQLEYFKLIGKELKNKVECFVIGGSAMMFYNAKAETKYVDLVFMDKESINAVKNILEKLGFEEKKNLIKIFKKYEEAQNKPIMMMGKDTRFDLFLREIITFQMTENIIDRVRESHEFENLIIKVVSPEDVILMKSATEREKDRADALSLINKFNIKWNIIIAANIS